jgi:hypothetical protein
VVLLVRSGGCQVKSFLVWLSSRSGDEIVRGRRQWQLSVCSLCDGGDGTGEDDAMPCHARGEKGDAFSCSRLSLLSCSLLLLPTIPFPPLLGSVHVPRQTEADLEVPSLSSWYVLYKLIYELITLALLCRSTRRWCAPYPAHHYYMYVTTDTWPDRSHVNFLSFYHHRQIEREYVIIGEVAAQEIVCRRAGKSKDLKSSHSFKKYVYFII